MSGYLAEFRENGYVTVPGLVAEPLLQGVEGTLRHLIRAAAARLPEEPRRAFQARDYGAEGLLHEGLNDLYRADPSLVQLVVDGICSSRAIHALVSDGAIGEMAAELTGAASVSDLSLGDTFMRVDQPAHLREHVKKIHLPYHQESGYFSYNVSADTGLVLWVPLFDCGEREGALKVRTGSHKGGKVEHEGYYEDPVRKVHWRVRLPEEILQRYPETTLDVKRGSAAFQHFHTFHRSGDNRTEQKVRYTILARFSNLLADDFVPISWKHK